MSHVTDDPNLLNVVGRRQLIKAMRDELLTTIAAIVGHGHMLYDDAAANDCPDEMLQDLRRLQESVKDLYACIKEELDSNWPELETDQFEQRFRRVRHDIINQLNHPLGLCQFLRLQDENQYFGSMADELKTLESKCKSCVAKLQLYKEVEVSTQVDVSHEPKVATVSPASFPEPAANRSGAGLAVGSVLVVDDNANNRELLAGFLQNEGHRVGLAADGQAALDTLHREEYDVVLLDLVMPGMNGFEVLQRLKSHDRLRHTPVIMVSGFFDPDHVVTCIEMGAEDHLPKPVDFKLLRARLNSALEKRRLREREFGQFFTPELARHFVRNPELLTQARDAEVTVLFCDVRGFSRISEKLGPTDTVNWLSDVMATLSDCVMEHHGVLVDYIGDELMAMWGAPEQVDDHAALACRAAVDILKSLPGINDVWRERIGATTDVGIGLNSGLARVGNTGSNRKFKYGPLGNVVNLASRVQGATKYLRSRLLVTGNTHDDLGDEFASRRLCKVRVVNIDAPVDLYEICLHDDSASNSLSARYEHALNQFEDLQLVEAATSLGSLLVDQPNDGPSLLLMSRVVETLLAPPEGSDPSDRIDPVWNLPGK